MEGSIDSYGLKAQFKFAVDDKAFASMGAVISHLEQIEQTVKATADAIKGSGLGSSFSQATSQMRSAIGKLGSLTSGITKQLTPLRAEFKALKAEARNIDFGDIGDDKAFNSATNSVNKYIASLKRLESQITGNTFQEREFSASLKTQQKVASNRVALAQGQRTAADSAGKIGKSQALRQTGVGVLSALADPMKSANELQKSMGGIQKLADDLQDVNKLQNSIMTLSAKMAVSDTSVSSVFEDLASAGKSFKPGELEKRISEAEQILKNANALDITVDRSTDLETALGAKYKKLSAQMAGGNVELTARTGSALNDLADKLQDVKISAQDIIPYMKVVINTVGEADNFKLPDIAAYSAALSATGTIEPEVAGSFLNRLGKNISENSGLFAKTLHMNAEEFNQAINTDKLGVITQIAQAYNDVKGGELAKGGFLGNLKIKSVQDQKLLQALATSLDVLSEARKVALSGMNGKEGQALSVDRELANVMKTSAFQSEKFSQSLKTLKDVLGLAIIQATLPFVKGLNAVIDTTIKLTQQFPLLTKLIAVSIYAFGALAAVVGTAGVVFFTFRQAAASASIASIAMQGAIIPLTGFYQTAIAAYTATNPLSGSLTLLRSGFSGLVRPLNSATAAMQLAGRASLSFLVSPLGLAIASLGGLYLILEMATPGVSLLGTAVGALGAPIAFVSGILIGFTKGILSAFFALGGGAAAKLATPFVILGEAIATAVKILANFEGQGEQVGQNLAKAVVAPFQNAIALIAGLWSATLGRIQGMLKPFADFAALIGMLLVHNLAENSPGPLSLIRALWSNTIGYLQAQLGQFLQFASIIGGKIGDVFTSKLAIIGTGASNLLILGLSRIIPVIKSVVKWVNILANVYQSNAESSSPIAAGFITLFAAVILFSRAVKTAFTPIGVYLNSFKAAFLSASQSTNPIVAGLIVGALAVSMAWGAATNQIIRTWSGLVDTSIAVGGFLVQLLNHGAADVVATAWDNSIAKISGLMQSLPSVAATVANGILSPLAGVATQIGSVISAPFAKKSEPAPQPGSADFVGPVMPPDFGKISSQVKILNQAISLIATGIPTAVKAVGFYVDLVGTSIASATTNLDTFGLAILALSSLPMALISNLKPLAEVQAALTGIAPELLEFITFISGVIPHALGMMLPGSVAIGIALGWNKGLENWAKGALTTTPDAIKNAVKGLFDAITPDTKEVFAGYGVNLDEISVKVQNAVDTITSVLNSFFSYLISAGSAAGELGDRILGNLRPIIEMKFRPFDAFDFRPVTQFLVVGPFMSGIWELATSSPVRQGLRTIVTTFSAIAVTIQGVVRGMGALIFSGVQLAASLLRTSSQYRAAEAKVEEVIEVTKESFAVTKESVLDVGQAIYQFAKSSKNRLVEFLRTIPFIGNALANTIEFFTTRFKSVFGFVGKFVPLFISTLKSNFSQAFGADFINTFKSVFLKLFVEIGAGIGAAFSGNLAAAKNLLAIFLKLFPLYTKTLGFKGAVKGLTPLDLIANYVVPEQKILQTKLTEILSAKVGKEGMDAALKAVGGLGKIKVLLLYVSPLIELLASITIGLLVLRSALEPLNAEWFKGADAIKANIAAMGQYGPVLSTIFGVGVTAIWLLRFAIIGLTETVIFALKSIPPTAKFLQVVFTHLGDIIGTIAKVIAVVVIGIATVIKTLVAAPLLAAPIAILGIFDALLYIFRASLQGIRAVSKAIGDSMVGKINQYTELMVNQDWQGIGNLIVTDLFINPFKWVFGWLYNGTISNFKLIVTAVVSLGNAVINAIAHPKETLISLGNTIVQQFQRAGDTVKSSFVQVAGYLINLIPPGIRKALLELVTSAEFMGKAFALALLWLSVLTGQAVSGVSAVEVSVTGLAGAAVKASALTAASITGILSAVVGLGTFLATGFGIVEYIRKFKELDAIVVWTGGKINDVQKLIGQMFGIITKPIAPGFADILAGVIKGFVSSLPAIILFSVLLATIWKKGNIISAISVVVKGIAGIVFGLMRAVMLALKFGKVIKESAGSFKTQTQVMGATHKVRSHFQGKGPLGYESDDIATLRAQQVEKSFAIVKFQKQAQKLYKREEKRITQKIIGLSNSDSATQKSSVENLTETVDKKGIFGTRKVTQLTEKGKLQREKYLVENMNLSSQGEFSNEVLGQLAKKTGVTAAYDKFKPKAENAQERDSRQAEFTKHLRNLAFDSQMEAQRVPEEFNKAVLGEQKVNTMIVGSLKLSNQATESITRLKTPEDYALTTPDIQQIKKSPGNNQAATRALIDMMSEVEEKFQELQLSTFDNDQLLMIAKAVGAKGLPASTEYPDANPRNQGNLIDDTQELLSYKVLNQLGKTKKNIAVTDALTPNQIFEAINKGVSGGGGGSFDFNSQGLKTLFANPALAGAAHDEETYVKSIDDIVNQAQGRGEIDKEISSVVQKLMGEQLQQIRRSVQLPDINGEAQKIADDLGNSNKKIRIGFTEVIGGAIGDFFKNFSKNISNLQKSATDSKPVRAALDKRAAAKEARVGQKRIDKINQIRSTAGVNGDYDLVSQVGMIPDVKEAFLSQVATGKREVTLPGVHGAAKLTKDMSVGGGKTVADIARIFGTISTPTVQHKLPPDIVTKLEEYAERKKTTLNVLINEIKGTNEGNESKIKSVIETGANIGKSLKYNAPAAEIIKLGKLFARTNLSIEGTRGELTKHQLAAIEAYADSTRQSVEDVLIYLKYGDKLYTAIENTLQGAGVISLPSTTYARLSAEYMAQILSFKNSKSKTAFNTEVQKLIEAKFDGSEVELENFIQRLSQGDTVDVFADLITEGLIPETKDLATLEKTFNVKLAGVSQGLLNSPRMQGLLDIVKGNLGADSVKTAMGNNQINQKDIYRTLAKVAKLGNLDPDQLIDPDITSVQVRQARSKRSEMFARKRESKAEFKKVYDTLPPIQQDSLLRGQVDELPDAIQTQIAQLFGHSGKDAIDQLTEVLRTSNILKGSKQPISTKLKNIALAPLRGFGGIAGISAIAENARYRNELFSVQNETIVAEEKAMKVENQQLSKARVARVAGLEVALIEAKRSRREVDQMLGSLKPVLDQLIETGNPIKKATEAQKRQLATLLNVSGESGLIDLRESLKTHETTVTKRNRDGSIQLDDQNQPIREIKKIDLTSSLAQLVEGKTVTDDELDLLVAGLKKIGVNNKENLAAFIQQVKQTSGLDELLAYFLKRGTFTDVLSADEQKTITEAIGVQNFQEVLNLAERKLPILMQFQIKIRNYVNSVVDTFTNFNQGIARAINSLRAIPFVGDFIADALLANQKKITDSFTGIGKGIKQLFTNVFQTPEKAFGKIPGVKQFISARKDYKQDRSQSLQGTLKDAGYSKIDDFRSEFVANLTKLGIADKPTQNEAVGAFLNPKAGGISQTFADSRELTKNKKLIEQAFAQSVSMTAAQVSQLIKSNKFTPNAVAPFQIYLLKVLPSAMLDVSKALGIALLKIVPSSIAHIARGTVITLGAAPLISNIQAYFDQARKILNLGAMPGNLKKRISIAYNSFLLQTTEGIAFTINKIRLAGFMPKLLGGLDKAFFSWSDKLTKTLQNSKNELSKAPKVNTLLITQSFQGVVKAFANIWQKVGKPSNDAGVSVSLMESIFHVLSVEITNVKAQIDAAVMRAKNSAIAKIFKSIFGVFQSLWEGIGSLLSKTFNLGGKKGVAPVRDEAAIQKEIKQNKKQRPKVIRNSADMDQAVQRDQENTRLTQELLEFRATAKTPSPGDTGFIGPMLPDVEKTKKTIRQKFADIFYNINDAINVPEPTPQMVKPEKLNREYLAEMQKRSPGEAGFSSPILPRITEQDSFPGRLPSPDESGFPSPMLPRVPSLIPPDKVQLPKISGESRFPEPMLPRVPGEAGFPSSMVLAPGQPKPMLPSPVPEEVPVVPFQQKLLVNLVKATKSTFQEIGNIVSGSATRTGAAWSNSIAKIKGVDFGGLVRAAIRTGKSIVDRLNHGAADVTADAWDRTQDVVTADMHAISGTAQATGAQIGNSMTQAAVKPIGLFGRLGMAIGKVGKAGLAIGAAVTATGFAAQQVSSSLATMGVIDEETSQKLYKLTEVFTLVGAVGGLAAPIIGALVSSLGAVVSVGGAVIGAVTGIGSAVFAFIISPFGLAAAGVVAAIFLINAAIKQFFGVDLLATAFSGIITGLTSGFETVKSLAPGAMSSFISAIAPLPGILSPIMQSVLAKLQTIFVDPFAPIFTAIKPVTDAVSGAFTSAINKIQNAWQFFIDNFGGKLLPIVKPALDIAQRLISALNHSPTVQIPLAWQGAVENIKGFLGDLLKFALAIGVSLVAALGVKKLSRAINTHGSTQTRDRSRNFSDKLQKFSLYANFANDIAQVSGVQMPDFIQPILLVTTFAGILGDLTSTMIPALTGAFGGVGTAIAGAFSTIAASVGGVVPLLGIVTLAIAALALAWHLNLFDIQGKTKLFVDWLEYVVVGSFVKIKEGWEFFSANFLIAIQAGVSKIPSAFIGAITQIETAWQTFVNNFGIRLQPVIQPALDIAQSLISALNHNPTEVIPEAWEGAVLRITDSLSSLPIVGKFIGNQLNKALGAKVEPEKYGPQLPASLITPEQYSPPLPPSPKKPWWSNITDFFGVAPAAASPAPITTDPGVLLDFTKELTQAIALAKGAGDIKATANLSGIASENKGQITANKYAEMIVPGADASMGGKYLQSAVSLINKRQERQEYGSLVGNAASTGIAAIQGKESWGDFQTAAGSLSSKTVSNISNSDFGKQAQASTAVAKESFENLTLEMQDRWQFLQREGLGDIGLLFEPGNDQAKAGFNNLGSSVSDFASASLTAITHLDFPGLQKAAVDFGTNAFAALKQIGSGFASAGLSAVVFGVYSQFALSPVGLALAVIALAGLAVATNFLGLRNIIFGLVGIVGGLIQALGATVKFIYQVSQGIGLIVSGIQQLDLDTIKLGFQATFSAITQYARQLWEAITQILGGIRQTFQGLFQGITQLFQGLLGAFLAPFSGVRAAIGTVVGAVRNLGAVLVNAIAQPKMVWNAFLQLLERIRVKVAGVTEAISSSSVGRAVRAVRYRATGQAGSMDSARSQVDFEERLKGKEPGLTIGDRVVAGKSKVGNFFGGLFGRGKKNTTDSEIPATVLPAETTDTRNPVAIPSIESPQSVAHSPEIGSLTAAQTEQTSKTTQAISSVSNALGTLGSSLSFVAPQFSGPLFAVAALGDSFLSMKVAIPELKETFKTLFPSVVSAGGATGSFNAALTWLHTSASGAWSAIASLLTPLYTYITTTYAAGGATGLFNASLNWLKASSMGSAIASFVASLYTYITTTYAAGGATGLFNASLNWLKASSMGSAIASLLTPLYTYIVTTLAATGVTGLFSAAISSLGAAAAITWAAITGPLLPFIIAIGAVIAVIGLVYLAFKNNFLGIGSLIGGIADVFQAFFGTLLGGAWDAIKSIFDTFGEEFGNIWKVLVAVGEALLIPFKPLFDLFGGSGAKGGLFGDFGKLLANIILLPLRLIVGVVNLFIRGISLIIQVVTVLGGIVVGVLLSPFMLLVQLGQGFINTLSFVGGLLFSIGKTIIDFVLWPFQQIGGIVEKITGFFAGIPVIGKLFGAPSDPQTEIQQFASGGLVQGRGTSTGDRVPAMLSSGEFVVNAAAARENYATLESMNSGSGLEVVPQPMPPLPTSISPPVASSQSMSMPPMQFSFTFGDIILQGANGADAAAEFVDNLEPQLEQRVQQILRRLLEFMK